MQMISVYFEVDVQVRVSLMAAKWVVFCWLPTVCFKLVSDSNLLFLFLLPVAFPHSKALQKKYSANSQMCWKRYAFWNAAQITHSCLSCFSELKFIYFNTVQFIYKFVHHFSAPESKTTHLITEQIPLNMLNSLNPHATTQLLVTTYAQVTHKHKKFNIIKIGNLASFLSRTQSSLVVTFFLVFVIRTIANERLEARLMWYSFFPLHDWPVKKTKQPR